MKKNAGIMLLFWICLATAGQVPGNQRWKYTPTNFYISHLGLGTAGTVLLVGNNSNSRDEKK